MNSSFTVLASGSGGNASLLESGGFGLLLDIGLGPRQLAGRLAESGRSWRSVQAVLLTHTHADHWNARTLATLLAKRIPIYCHNEHLDVLRIDCPMTLVRPLEGSGLLRTYSGEQEFTFGGGLRCLPLPLRHDGGATFGFRFAAAADMVNAAWSVGYAADLGCWDGALAEGLADVDLLALEFNHDVPMQLASGRHPTLIARVLGDDGHLSNEQAAELLLETLRRSTPGRLQRLVQLHLSRQCNRPDLAVEAAQSAVNGLGVNVQIHTASQDRPSPTFDFAAAGGAAVHQSTDSVPQHSTGAH